jgi:hypothetical protein
MTPKKQVSPAIRILRGERDASARATHLEAATRKFLVTTNERKQMSTKTNFKRIALVAVAALGMGVLSSVPSQGAILADTFTVTAGTAGAPTIAKSDSTTATTLTVKFLSTAVDTVTISTTLKSKPSAATNTPSLNFFGSVAGGGVDTSTSTGATAVALSGSESLSANDTAVITGTQNGYSSAALLTFMDSSSVGTRKGTRVTGTYVYTAIVTAYSGSLATQVKTVDLTFTIAALASESKVASPANSTAFLSAAGGGTSDAVVTAVATASTSPAGIIEVKLRNASGTGGVAARESVTVTTNVGTVGITGGTFGRSVVLAYNTDDSLSVYVRPDGTAGTATITVTTPSVTFASKTLVFYAAAPTSLVAARLNSTLAAGSNDAALSVVAKDVNGNAWAGSLYVYSGTLTTISDTGTTCSYVSANSRHECTVTGVAAGTADITVRSSAATAITATTVSSNAVTMTVSTSSPATVKLAFDKATYAPGEKATLLVSVLDSTGKPVPARAWTNLFATGGITLSTAAGNGSDTTTAVSFSTYSLASLALGALTDPVAAYTLYMPAAGGTITATATGGTALPLAGQVEVKATATVTDSGAAALAAVTALATQVASLRTLITTLTNLVLKIQKKVKA